jgi:hypothetical protein
MYKPKHLKRWTMPANYCGAMWPNHYSSGFGRSRDSDCLERSNFRVALAALGGESDCVTVARESHWAVGWVEWVAIEADGTPESDEALAIADKLQERVSNYPVLNEEDFSTLERDEADEIWANCYNVKERVRYIRAHASQFEFHDYADLLNCVRGKYFAGYASELIQ